MMKINRNEYILVNVRFRGLTSEEHSYRNIYIKKINKFNVFLIFHYFPHIKSPLLIFINPTYSSSTVRLPSNNLGSVLLLTIQTSILIALLGSPS